MASVLVLPHGAPESEWLAARRRGVTASEIAAVMGISPWESPFSMWWRKREGWEADLNEEMEAGRRLEAAVAQWFADQHPEIAVRPTGLWAHGDRPWQMATPDRLLLFPVEGSGIRRCGALLECKVAYSWDGWGEEGTDEIPVHYRAQVLWQMDTVGVDVVFIAVFSGLGFRQYEVRRDEADLELMREAARRFMASLERGEQPDVDSHAATTRTLKRLHPTVEDIDIEVPVEFAEGYRRARALAARAAALVDRYDARARVLLGNGRRLVVGKKLVVSRSVYDQSGDNAELLALDGEWPTTDRLNPGRAKSYV